jgi:hypothetical protein
VAFRKDGTVQTDCWQTTIRSFCEFGAAQSPTSSRPAMCEQHETHSPVSEDSSAAYIKDWHLVAQFPEYKVMLLKSWGYNIHSATRGRNAPLVLNSGSPMRFQTSLEGCYVWSFSALRFLLGSMLFRVMHFNPHLEKDQVLMFCRHTHVHPIFLTTG